MRSKSLILLSLVVVGGAAFAVGFSVGQEKAGTRVYEGWDGVTAEYINPASEKIQKPLDAEVYLEEWEALKRAKL